MWAACNPVLVVLATQLNLLSYYIFQVSSSRATKPVLDGSDGSSTTIVWCMVMMVQEVGCSGLQLKLLPQAGYDVRIGWMIVGEMI